VFPVDAAGGTELGQQDLVELLEHAGLVPVAQASPTGHPTTATHLGGQVFPANAGLEDKEDAGEAGAIVNRLSPAFGPRRVWRQQRLDDLPKFIRDQRLGHLVLRDRSASLST